MKCAGQFASWKKSARSAERFDAAPVNFAGTDPAEAIMEATDGAGVDCGVEAVGHQAHDAGGQEHPAMVLDEFVEVARSTRADAGAGA